MNPEVATKYKSAFVLNAYHRRNVKNRQRGLPSQYNIFTKRNAPDKKVALHQKASTNINMNIFKSVKSRF